MSNAETSPTDSTKGAPPLTDESSIVDALNDVFGKQSQTRARAIHAKRVVMGETFTPSAGGALSSVAPHLQDAAVTVRFSNFSGVPSAPDTDGLASSRGMALRFHLPDGSTTDIVSHSFNGFPCATNDAFRGLFVALGTSGPGVASTTPFDRFLSSDSHRDDLFERIEHGPISFKLSVRDAAYGVSFERRL